MSLDQDTQRRDRRRREGHVKTGAETGVMQLQAKEPQEAPGAARGEEGSSTRDFRGREHGPVDILISGSGTLKR